MTHHSHCRCPDCWRVADAMCGGLRRRPVSFTSTLHRCGVLTSLIPLCGLVLCGRHPGNPRRASCPRHPCSYGTRWESPERRPPSCRATMATSQQGVAMWKPWSRGSRVATQMRGATGRRVQRERQRKYSTIGNESERPCGSQGAS